MGHMEGPMAPVNRLWRGPFGAVGGSIVESSFGLLMGHLMPSPSMSCYNRETGLLMSTWKLDGHLCEAPQWATRLLVMGCFVELNGQGDLAHQMVSFYPTNSNIGYKDSKLYLSFKYQFHM